MDHRARATTHYDALTRREFVLTTLAAGFAAAVTPIHAETVVHTEANGLEAGEVAVPVGDRDIPGYRAMPKKSGPFPVVLVVQEIFGVHEHIQDVCRRFAQQGYFAIAPALYARQGDVSAMPDVQEIVSKVVSKVPDSQVMSDLDATVAWAQKTGKGDTSRLGITGFCWGGRVVWLYAAHSEKLRAGVAWYGRLSGVKTELQPAHPIDVAPKLRAPVLGLHGGADSGIPLSDVEAMSSALSAAGKAGEIVVYPDAPHGFHADYRPSYRPDAAKDGWRRLLDWFKKNGVA